MAEIHLRLDDDFVEAINKGLEKIRGRTTESSKYKVLTATDIAREALAVYQWVVESTADDQAVVAADKRRNLVSQLATRNLPALAPSGFPGAGNPATPAATGEVS